MESRLRECKDDLERLYVREDKTLENVMSFMQTNHSISARHETRRCPTHEPIY